MTASAEAPARMGDSRAPAIRLSLTDRHTTLTGRTTVRPQELAPRRVELTAGMVRAHDRRQTGTRTKRSRS